MTGASLPGAPRTALTVLVAGGGSAGHVQPALAVADALVAAGVKGLLNFAPGVLQVPAGVSVVSVDLTLQLEQLAFLVQANGVGGLD